MPGISMNLDIEFRIRKIHSKIKKLEGKLRTLSTFRLISFLSIPGTAIFFYTIQLDILISLLSILPIIALFYGIVFRYNQLEAYKNRFVSMENFLDRENLRKNKESKKLFRAIPVSEEIRKNHPFSEDLNLFEKDGLFSLMDTTSTVQGENLFIQNLLRINPESDEDLLKRQSYVQKLTKNPWFSYKFIRIASENWEFFLGKKWNTAGWKKKDFKFFESRRILKLVFPIYSLISGLIILSSVLFQLPFGSGLFLLNLILFITYRRDSVKELSLLDEIQKRKSETYRLVSRIHRETKTGETKAGDIKKVNQVFKRFDRASSRLHHTPILHFIANALYLHDLWVMKKLEKWKTDNQEMVANWIEELEEIDSLMPLLHLKFCNPDWVFPNISSNHDSISGKNLAHPLLKKSSAIPNPLYSLDRGKILLITGSNMAGKTTYMRTVGVNILLGLCGGPCFAEELSFPPLKITCSVKNQDSLTEGISLFYSEARRLAEIFSSLRESRETYLILLDEILKGTNTKERYLASEKILMQLQGKNAFTLCTTHDLDLAKIPNLDLRHFTEKIEDDNMSFDYKIRDGVVQSTNALFILRKEGVISN